MSLAGLQSKSHRKFVKRKFEGGPEKFYEVPGWSFEVSIQSFILNFEVSDQSSEVKGGGTLEPF